MRWMKIGEWLAVSQPRQLVSGKIFERPATRGCYPAAEKRTAGHKEKAAVECERAAKPHPVFSLHQPTGRSPHD